MLCVTALGENIRLAQKLAYESAAAIHWDGMQYRKDIGYRAIGVPPPYLRRAEDKKTDETA